MQRSHCPSPRAKKRSALLIFSSLVPVAAAVFATVSGCGSGKGTSYINPPLTGLTPSSVVPSAFPSGVLPSVLFPSGSPSASAPPSVSASPSPGGGTSTVYTVTDVRQSVGAPDFLPFDVNTAGQFVGLRAGISPFAQVSTNGTLKEITFILANTINDAGQIAGQGVYGGSHASVVTDGTVRDLGTLGGTHGSASSINRSGQIVGSSEILNGTDDFTEHAFLYENGAMRDLGTLSGGNQSYASDINDAGVIVGNATVAANNEKHPMIYENGQMREIPSISGGSQPGIAFAINNRGQAVGISGSGNAQHAFLHENGVTRDLGTFGGSLSQAKDINEAGQIVGYATAADETGHGFLYQNNTLIDLNQYNPDPNGYSEAIAINENGQILLLVGSSGENSWSTFLLLTPSTRKR